MDLREIVESGIEEYNAEISAKAKEEEIQRQKELEEYRILRNKISFIREYFDRISICEGGAKMPKHCKCRFYISAIKGNFGKRFYPHSYKFADCSEPQITILVDDSESCTGFTLEQFAKRLGRYLAGDILAFK